MHNNKADEQNQENNSGKKESKEIDLSSKLEILRKYKELLKIESNSGKLAKTHRIKKAKKEIARILTEFNKAKKA